MATALTQRTILKTLAAGGVIRVEYVNHPPSSARRSYRLQPGNKTLREETVKQLEEDQLIRPLKDGLFDDAPPQTYVLFRASEGGA